MDKLMRNYIDVYCTFRAFSSGVANTHIVRLTDDFVSFEESTINIERDGMSGTMTSIVYEVKFAKSEKTLFLKSAFEAFTTKDYTFALYDSIVRPDADNMDASDIENNSFADIFRHYEGVDGNNYIDPKDIKLIICFAKDDAIDKTNFNDDNDIRDIEEYDGFQRVAIADLNYEEYVEDMDYITIEASSQEIQRYLKSKGDFTYDIPVADLAPLEDVWFQHKLDIPLFTQHTTPSFNPSTNEGVNQSIISKEDRDKDDGWVYYFPSIRWDSELEGFDKDFKSTISFGSQRGDPVTMYMENRNAQEYLIRNLGKKPAKMRIKGSIDFSCRFRTTMKGDVADYRDDIRQLYRRLKIRLIAIPNRENKDEDSCKADIYGGHEYLREQNHYSGAKIIKEQEYGGWFNPNDTFSAARPTGYWEIGHYNGHGTVRNFSFDQEYTLDGLGGSNTIVLVVEFHVPNFNKDKVYGSKFYFTENSKIKSSFGSVQSDENDIATTLNKFPIVKGVRPHYILEHIFKKEWNENFKIKFIDNGDTDEEDLMYRYDSLLPELGGVPIPTTLFLASESLSYMTDAKFHIDVLEILKWYQAKGYEYSILNDTTMLLAPREYFYKNRVNAFGTLDANSNTITFNGDEQLFEQGTMELSTNSSMCYTDVLYGFKKEDYTVFSGACDPVSPMKYETGYISDEGKTLDLVTDIRMDFYGMYYLLHKSYGLDVDRTNDTTFALDCKIGDVWDERGYWRYGVHQIWDYVKAVVRFDQNGLTQDITYYNALNIPRVALWLFNLKYMRIFARGLKFISSDNYTPEIGNIVVGENGGSISSLIFGDIKGSIDLTAPNDAGVERYQPHFSLAIARVEVGSLRKIWAVNGIDAPNKIIRFIDNEGIIRYGFIKSYEYNLWNNKSGEMELLLAKPKIK